ncbi:peptidoglycan-binding domain-containing protein [Brevundimonas sp. SL161]|uniref:peptidoglycan-binding domain-containing protein n=1 Tax=Brevundimonas sp. SL161 TaxID=2804613 RepID=UPI003CEC6D7C
MAAQRPDAQIHRGALGRIGPPGGSGPLIAEGFTHNGGVCGLTLRGVVLQIVWGAMMKILEVQTALANLGYRPGPLDGVWGRQTAAAVKEFQTRHGLTPDGVLGPIRLQRCFPALFRARTWSRTVWSGSRRRAG